MIKQFTALIFISIFLLFGCDKNSDEFEKKEYKVKIEKKIDYSKGRKIVSADSTVSFWVPEDWEKQDGREFWSEKNSHCSMNIQKDINDMSLGEYSQLAMENIKKIYPSFTTIINEIKDSFGDKMALIHYELVIHGNKMVTYSLIMDKNSIKYVLTTGCKESDFKKNSDIFFKIINSFTFE